MDPQLRSPFVTIACVAMILQSLTACDRPRPPDPEGGTFPLQLLQKLPLLTDARPDLEGKILLINFWATWCVPCREEMPYLQQLSERLDPARFAVVGIAVDDDAHLIREFLLHHRIRFANYQDGASQLASTRLGLGSYPQTFIVTPQGVIEQRIDRAISRDWSILENLPGSHSGIRLVAPVVKLDG